MPLGFGVVVAFVLNAFRVLMASQLGRWVVGALLFMGITYGTQKIAIEPSLDFITGLMQGGPAGDIGTYAMAWLGVMRLDTAVSMLLSCIAIKRGMRNAKFALYASRVPVGAPR